MGDINKIFIWSIVISVVGTVLVTLLKYNPMVIFAVGVLPLVYYFVRLLVISKSGLSQTTVDSIYYFGFIVTITSLAASVLSVAIHGIDGNINHLIAQFGVGLLATGLALVFRMVLIAKLESLTQKDISETIDEYVRRIDHVVSKVEASADSFDSLSTLLIERTKNTCESMHEDYKEGMLASSHAFQKELLGILAIFSQEATASIKSITSTSDEFYALVKNIKLDAHVADINSHAGAISAGLAKFSEDAVSFSKVTQLEIQNIAKASVAESFDGMNKVINSVAARSSEMLLATQAEMKKIDFQDENEAIKSELRTLTRNINTYAKKILAKGEQVDFMVDEVASKTALAIQASMTQRGVALSESMDNIFRENVEAVHRSIEERIHRSMPMVFGEVSEKLATVFTQVERGVESIQASLASPDFKTTVQSVQTIFSELSSQTETLTSLVNSLNKEVAGQVGFNIEGNIHDALSKVSTVWGEQIEVLGQAMNEKIISLSVEVSKVGQAADIAGIQTDFINLSREVKSTMQSLEAMKVSLEEVTFEARRSMDSLLAVQITANEISSDIKSDSEGQVAIL